LPAAKEKKLCPENPPVKHEREGGKGKERESSEKKKKCFFGVNKKTLPL